MHLMTVAAIATEKKVLKYERMKNEENKCQVYTLALYWFVVDTTHC